uniref:Peroxisomal membrane protein PEX13 n=1 Tax=Latimeria chalumnae TaxID=7897 RepID=H3AE44_LATCH
MAAQPPPKPWERRALGCSYNSAFRSPDVMSCQLQRPGQPMLSRGLPPHTRIPPPITQVTPPPNPSTTRVPAPPNRVPPPLPPRLTQQTGDNRLSTYRPAYTPYGNSFYGTYNPYSYGGLGYNRFRMDDIPPSRFVRQAEESSRGAFQSIESIVHAFASVSMMMDATFSAVYNSFRAVLDVANHFSRLKVHFTKVFSAFALVRTLRYLYKRLQRMLGLQKNSDVEDAWVDSERTMAVINPEDRAADSAKSWPIFLFLAVILGGPYLIWKLLSSCSVDSDKTGWASGEDDHGVARAEYDFSATSDDEISFRAGDMLNLAPREQQSKVCGWLLASRDGKATGLIPANYVKILGIRRGRRQAELERTAEQRQSFPNNTQAEGATE